MTTTIIGTAMSCTGREDTVETALETIENVSSVSTDREQEAVTVEGETDPTTLVARV